MFPIFLIFVPFQSLKGHQPKWNICAICREKGAARRDVVSIPKRASAKVKPFWISANNGPIAVSIPKRASAKVKHMVQADGSIDRAFQSLKGHQPKWNNQVGELPIGIFRFQSLKGHQPKWNVSDLSSAEWVNRVSIPKRASAKVKLGWFLRSSFDSLFQSLKGHQPKWNRPSLEIRRRRGISFNP